jgi:CubicO group peptidase (beta-lactamase class C family)
MSLLGRLFLMWTCCVGLSTAVAADKWEYVQDRSPEQFQKDFDRLVEAGYRPVTLQFSTFDSAPLYSALFVSDQPPFQWLMRSGIGLEECEKLLTTESKKGFRPIALSACLQSNKPAFGAVLVRDGGRRPWNVKLRLTPAALRTEIAAMAKRDMRVESLASYPGQGGVRLAALFVDAAGQSHAAKIDLVAEDVKSWAEQAWANDQQRVVALTAYPAGNKTKFVAAAVNDGASGDIVTGLSREALAQDVERRRGGTFGVRAVVPYQAHGKMLVAGVYESPPLSLPVTGHAEPELTVFDQAMQGLMSDKRFRGATLAVSRNGRLLLSRGYGYSDAEERSPMPPDAMMRIASNVKPLTAILIRELIRAGRLEAETKIRPLLAIQPPDGRTLDERWNHITVEMLLRHRGGWDREAAVDGHPDGFDPMFANDEIRRSLNRKLPLKPRDFIDFMAGQSLQFDPGEKYAYSNFGYCVLGRVAEKVTGQDYIDALRSIVLDPVDARDVKRARSRPEDRDPREPVYRDGAVVPSVVSPTAELVRVTDGGLNIEAMDAHGGVIASSPDLLKVLDRWWIDGLPREPGERRQFRHLGSLPGTFSVMIQRPDGVNIVCNINQRSDPEVAGDNVIPRTLEEVAEGIREWPPEQ